MCTSVTSARRQRHAPPAASPLQTEERWVRSHGGQRMVDVVIVSNGSDPEMQALQAHVLRLVAW